MKKCTFLLIIISIFCIYGCDNIAGINNDFDIKKDLAGTWTLTMSNKTMSSVFSVNGDQVTVDGMKHNGQFSGNSYYGYGTKNDITFSMDVTMDSKNKIHGVMKVIYSNYSNSDNFTATR